ncbi:MAG: GxxExxY protein [Nitrospinae bacterium RIFCSPLOWO2_12_39_15]|nr:MAG: GxxExxY protein [Nitrospinae bacterium RIFCSPLOWO2_12_39_15]
MELLHKDITDKILKAFYDVYNILGCGFLEKVYENALFHELNEMGLLCERQKSINVYYKNKKVGVYFADIIAENCVIIEIKAAEVIMEEHKYQLINYLKATGIEVGLLLNFGKKAEFKRKIFQRNLCKSVKSASSTFYK